LSDIGPGADEDLLDLIRRQDRDPPALEAAALGEIHTVARLTDELRALLETRRGADLRLLELEEGGPEDDRRRDEEGGPKGAHLPDGS
jgi:hypothetical protein